MKKKKKIIEATERFGRKCLEKAEGGHDWNHVERVLANAKKILKKEEANKLVVTLGILLHDIADPKFHQGDEQKGPSMAYAFLKETELPENKILEVIDIIKNISFKGGFNKKDDISLELMVARDADRLDAIGAIGIARAFNYGGYKGRPMFVPGEEPQSYDNAEDYRNSHSSTINHFYEKLLLLKDGMHTDTGKKIAKKRHDFMKKYLKEFLNEASGKR